MSYLTDSKDASLLKEVKEYMTRVKEPVLTTVIIDKILQDLHKKYSQEEIRNGKSKNS